ncbi:MAG: TetR family transcriptional regulator [Myxococcales bacterium]|nr:TetR family transcriptional regulator [Myxococcales bacterium]
MATQRRVTPRKRPSQGRSKATVEAIVQATARVLLKDGYEACTTNRVAETAGVSIGSVYQYFPNKESLVVAVMEGHLGQMQEALARRLGELSDADLPTVVKSMVGGMLEMHRIQPRLHRVLLEQVPRIGALKRLHELNDQYEPLVAAWLEAHQEQLELPNPGAAAYVMIAAVEGVVSRVMLEKPGWVELGVLEPQLTRLILGYLAPHLVPITRRAPSPAPAAP